MHFAEVAVIERAGGDSGSVNNLDGELVDGTDRANTMAEYFEKIQWKMHPAISIARQPLGPVFPIREDDFTAREVGVVISKLKQGKAPEPGDIPAEYWKAFAHDPKWLDTMTKLIN